VTTDAPTPLPRELRDRVLAAARRARAAGRSLPGVPEISAVEAFSRAAAALLGLLTALPPEAWRTPVLRDLDVQGLVGHLIGVEIDMRRALAGDQGVAYADHVASTQPAAEQQAGRPPEDTRREWRLAMERTADQVRGADLDAVVLLHGMRLPLGSLLVVRAFELWTHENDIRRVVGLPASVPDPSTLRLMTDLAVHLLPVGVAGVAGESTPFDVHLVLTGPGGGTWDLVLGKRDAPVEVPEVAIVADAVAFCRLVADRIDPAELDAHLTGATTHAATVFAGAAALALD
jgi:uncharacterized protein (TIGR03083 family)